MTSRGLGYAAPSEWDVSVDLLFYMRDFDYEVILITPNFSYTTWLVNVTSNVKHNIQ